MEKITIDVHGEKIGIYPLGYIIKVQKKDEDSVLIVLEGQGMHSEHKPVNVREKYGVSSDEFINEFESRVISEREVHRAKLKRQKNGE